MDPASIAATAVGLISALWSSATQTLAERGGESLAQILLGKIRRKFSGDSYNEQLLDGLNAQPGSAARETNLKSALTELLKNDQEFCHELAKTISEEAPQVAQSMMASNSGIVAHGSVTMTAGRDATGRDNIRGRAK